MGPRALLVDDEPLARSLGAALLRRVGCSVVAYSDASPVMAALEGGEVDILITDLSMPGMTGTELCEKVVARHPDIPVIVLTAHGTLESAVMAIRAGAYDFITKPLQEEAVSVAIDRAYKHRNLKREVVRLRRELSVVTGDDGLVGSSEEIRRVRSMIDRVAQTDVSVLLQGETGTGKEVAARELHRKSHRSSGPFVVVNCAAMPENLLESELFGHVKGAFTDARSNRVGLFAEADGGTLFLDEIGELPLPLQPKLLRALQERVIRPVGASGEVSVDVRLVSATNRDLERAVKQGTFREDLYFRMNVLQIELPPLRLRGGDVVELAQRFLAKISAKNGKDRLAFSPEAQERLARYSWPGNVRELHNCVERAVALARGETIDVVDLPEKIAGLPMKPLQAEVDISQGVISLEEVERKYILRVVEVANGNKTLAASMLGLDRATLYRKLALYAATDAAQRGN
ncbi:MAG: sigma-54 dependent transcriptional regulator [Polyangiaceae bacterium]